MKDMSLRSLIIALGVTSGLYAESVQIVHIAPDAQAIILSVAQQLTLLKVTPPPAMQVVFASLAANNVDISRTIAFLAIHEYRELVKNNPQLKLTSFEVWAESVRSKRAAAKK